MHNTLIQDLAAIFLTGGLLGWVFKSFLKLPLILGYILAGIILAAPWPYTPHVISTHQAETLSEVGILLLMFSMGLHFGIKKIASLGFAPLIVGITQALLMWFVGTKVAEGMGLNPTSALFLGAIVSTCSTITIIKILEDLQLKTARFAENLFTVLLVEDAVAIFIIIYLSASNSPDALPLWLLVPLFLASIFIWWLLGTIAVPRFINAAFLSGKEELLVIISIGLALGLAFLSEYWKFSPALGAFIMGSIIAESREIKKIEGLIEPVKNLFGAVFFVCIGLLFDPSSLVTEWRFILTLVATIVFGKLTFNLILNLLVGRSFKDAIRISGSMGQIGELSFVIAKLALAMGALSAEMFSSVVATAILTMLLTPFMVRLSLKTANVATDYLPPRFAKLLESYSEAIVEFSLHRKLPSASTKKSVFPRLGYFFHNFKARLQKNYRMMTSHNVTTTLDRLAPWDEYLTQVSVSVTSPVVGKSLLQLHIREKIGVNIVAIERENYTIVSPNASEIIFPGDTLLVYGDEKSVTELEALCQENSGVKKAVTLDECILASLFLGESHPFVGKSILELAIRINYKCIVLAVNRNNVRVKNPVSDFIFHPDDELFLFGTKTSLENIRALK